MSIAFDWGRLCVNTYALCLPGILSLPHLLPSDTWGSCRSCHVAGKGETTVRKMAKLFSIKILWYSLFIIITDTEACQTSDFVSTKSWHKVPWTSGLKICHLHFDKWQQNGAVPAFALNSLIHFSNMFWVHNVGTFILSDNKSIRCYATHIVCGTIKEKHTHMHAHTHNQLKLKSPSKQCTDPLQIEAVLVQKFHGQLHTRHLREAGGSHCCRTTWTLYCQHAKWTPLMVNCWTNVQAVRKQNKRDMPRFDWCLASSFWE